MIWTICFLVNKKTKLVCLALKKRGHGEGRWNGAGGKPKAGETLEDAVRRETYEELGVKIINLVLVAEIEFKDLPTKSSHAATAYICNGWEGEPAESEEMKPQWFEIDQIPYDEMWSADKIWIPLVLKGEKIKAVFEYSEGDTLTSQSIVPL